MITETIVFLAGLALCLANGGMYPRDCFRPNEMYSCGSACQTTCWTLNEPCPIINIMCNDLCYCIPGYARDQTGSCIPVAECSNRLNGICGENEEYRFGHHLNNECHAMLWPQYINQRSRFGCYCIQGYLKDHTGLCVPKDQCSPMPESSTTVRSEIM